MKTLLAALVIVLSLTPTVSATEPGPETDRLDAARMLIFDRDWPKAVVELRRVLQEPHEPLRDEASYWLAQSLFQMGSDAEALDVIARLEREHPRSRWALPAKSLRVEIAQRSGRSDLLWRIAVAPTPMAPPQTPLPHMTPPAPLRAPRPPRATPRPPSPPAVAPLPSGLTMTDVRIQALSGLLREDPERAVPVLREIVVDEVETPQARRALFVLGLSPHVDARETVKRFAQTGPDGLRVVAIEQIARWPVRDARGLLVTAYASGSGRVKLQVLRSLAGTRADRELIRIARTEKDPELRRYAIVQLRQVDTDAARAFLRTVK